VVISDTDFHALVPVNRRYNKNELQIKTMSITINKNVWLGEGRYICPGVTIGENSVIGARAVAVGVPAKEIKYFE